MTTEPVRPPEAYERYLREQRVERQGWKGVGTASTKEPSRWVAARLTDRVNELAQDLIGLSHDIHDHPELNFKERFAAAAVVTLIGRHGLNIEVGEWGLETAFRASVGSGQPHIAILAEYDALPELGHACGHNIICATAVGAFLAVSPLIPELGGRVSLMGTPAEEGGGGKELIARAGGFDDVDAAIMAHPADQDCAHAQYLALREVDVTYHGLAAHAATHAYLGRNALDAAVNGYISIAQLRQHVLAEERIHGVIREGGITPNVVPERAISSYYLRSPTVETLEELTDRVDAILIAAAEMTATRAEIVWDVSPLCLPVRTNHSLASRYIAAMADQGRSVLQESARLSGSTDLGNVSFRLPAIHPNVAITSPGVPTHSHEFARAAISPAADRAVVDTAVALARTAADYLADAELRRQVADEFEAAGGVLDVARFDRPAKEHHSP